MSAPVCLAIVAHFAWFVQRCHMPAVGTITVNGEEWPVCAEHAKGAES